MQYALRYAILNCMTKEKPYVVYNGKKYVRGFGMMPYKGDNIKMAKESLKDKTLKQVIYGK